MNPTTEKLISLANDYANADAVFDAAQRQQALRTAVESLVAERDELRQILADSVKALGTGAGCAPTCSLDFLRGIPDEIKGTVAALRGQR